MKETEDASPKNIDRNYVALFSEVKNNNDQVLEEFERKRDLCVAKMGSTTVVHVIELCAVHAQSGAVRSGASLAIRSNIVNVHDKGEVAELMHKAALRAVIHSVTFHADINALRKEDQLMGSLHRSCQIMSRKKQPA